MAFGDKSLQRGNKSLQRRNKNIQRGDKGTDVVELQLKLN